MRKTKTALLFIIFVISLSQTVLAQKPKTVFDQLVEVNKQWQLQSDIDPASKSIEANNLTPQQLIVLHLQETEKLLRKRSTIKLSPSLIKSRQANLDTLHAYWQRGLFPVNDLHSTRQPYFIDKNNNYCAVGYLMKQSGGDAIAKEIQRTENYSYLFDIANPRIMKWAATSGLTLDELALIQPSYDPGWTAAIMEFHYNNAGPDVNEYIEVHDPSGDARIVTFTSILFYNEAGVLYKTLAVSDMRSYSYTHYSLYGTASPGKVYYYTFPATESFADKGKIELKGTYQGTPVTIAYTTYNDVSVTSQDYNSSARTFNIGENENTPINTSLTYCGYYGNNSWNLQSLPATIGYQNPCTVMPIGLSAFNYKVNNNKVELTWETKSESNNSHFEIERSNNGIDFSSIGKVKAIGNSNNSNTYSFTDNNPNYINHYRLKQVDLDGRISYSKILFVKFVKGNPLVLVQNLVKTTLQVQISTEQSNIGSVIIYDFTGRQVADFKGKTGNQTLNIANLNVGKYLIRLLTKDGRVYNQQFVKE